MTLENNYDRWISMADIKSRIPQKPGIPAQGLAMAEGRKDPQDAIRAGHKRDMTILKIFLS